MRILVTGSSGRVGYQIANYFYKNRNEVVNIFMRNKTDLPNQIMLDITEKEGVDRLFNKYKPDIVIHSAALTNVELCETSKEFAYIYNVRATENIVSACEKNRSRIIFLSTSFVYSGKKRIYNEEDQKDPINYYGVTKAQAEEVITRSDLDFLILRTDQPYDWIRNWQQDSNVTRVLKKLEANLEYEEIIDWYNNPTFIPDLVRAISKLIEIGGKGIYHAVGKEYISRYEWALKIADVFNKDKTLIKPIESSKLKMKSKRPNANLSNKKIEKDTGITFATINQGLEIMKTSGNIFIG